MRSIAFIFRSLWVSIAVALRMVPILLLTGFTLYLILDFLKDEPLALLFVLGIIYTPLTIFLYIAAIRCGLVSLKASGAPQVKKLISATFRFMRFNMLIHILCFVVVGIGGTTMLIKFMAPQVWEVLFDDFGFYMIKYPMRFVEAIANVPLAIFPIFALSNVVAIALMGTNAAGLGATAAVYGPNHDAVWGLSKQFTRLFLLGLLVLVAPWMAIILYLGTPMTGISHLNELHEWVFIGMPFFNAWSWCVMAAGMALAYVYTLEDYDAERAQEREEQIGHVFDRDELRALRQSRQQSMSVAH